MAEGERIRAQRLAALLTVSQAMLGSQRLDGILSTVAQQMRAVIQVDECVVLLLDEAGQFLRPAARDGIRSSEEWKTVQLEVGEGIAGSVALTGRGEVVNRAEEDARGAPIPDTSGSRSSVLCVPLWARDRVIGVITLTRFGPDRRFLLAEDLEIGTLFAALCSAAISNARMYEQIELAYGELRDTQRQLVQSAKLNALGEMAGGVAHDFNNILAAILGRTQLLLRAAEDAETQRQLCVIEQAALDGARTVRRVQEFTRLRQDERFEPLQLDDVLREVVEFTRPAWQTDAKKRGIVIELQLELEARRPVAGDASELREVFTNLLLNAVDAMPQGGKLVLRSEDAGDWVVVRVRDTGIGMSPEIQARAFEPFFTTKPVQGTGLGLSLAYGIVTRHRGTVAIESQPGLGTEFQLRFPVSAVAVVAAKALRATPGPFPRLSVLVVDDEEPVLEVLADMLRHRGQKVRVALGGHAGLEEFERESPEVVFSDLGMPEVNGWDVARQVKSRRPEVPVVLVTGWGTQLEKDNAAACGVDLILAKPFSMEDVDRVLRRVGRILEPARLAA